MLFSLKTEGEEKVQSILKRVFRHPEWAIIVEKRKGNTEQVDEMNGDVQE